MAKIGIAPVFVAVMASASGLGCGPTLYRNHTIETPTSTVVVKQTRSRHGDETDIREVKIDSAYGFGPYGFDSAYGSGIMLVPAGMPASGGARAMEAHGLGHGIFPYGPGVSAIVMPHGTVDEQARKALKAHQQVLIDHEQRLDAQESE